MPSLPNFTSIHQVRKYLNDHRDHLSMVDITNACDWALDPGFIQRDAIANFVNALPYGQQHELSTTNSINIATMTSSYLIDQDEQQQPGHDDQQHLSKDECLLCCRPYDVNSGAHSPVVLPCGHVVGGSCLKKSLKDTDICFECGATVFTIPVATTIFANPEHEGIIRGLVQSGGVFLEEKSSVSGSDKSYAAFFRWAYGHGTDHDSIIARLHARETIGKLDISL